MSSKLCLLGVPLIKCLFQEIKVLFLPHLSRPRPSHQLSNMEHFEGFPRNILRSFTRDFDVIKSESISPGMILFYRYYSIHGQNFKPISPLLNSTGAPLESKVMFLPSCYLSPGALYLFSVHKNLCLPVPFVLYKRCILFRTRRWRFFPA